MAVISVTIGTAIQDELEKHVGHSTADAEHVNLILVTLIVATQGHVQEVSYQNEIELILYSLEIRLVEPCLIN